MRMMRLTLIFCFLLAVPSFAFAHCGSCGAGDEAGEKKACNCDSAEQCEAMKKDGKCDCDSKECGMKKDAEHEGQDEHGHEHGGHDHGGHGHHGHDH